MTAKIEINGEARAIVADTVEALLHAEQINPLARGVAVAVNGAVVPRHRWSQTAISPGDRIEIVKPFSGG